MEAADGAEGLLPQRRLVLCFDGTGNKFLGNDSDTNVVKIYQMLDRKQPNQFHYYQPGIGTYVDGQRSASTAIGRFFQRLKSSISTALDQGLGTSFESHVIAGYQFIMRYFSPGDAIYIFGFSRGAYTARFLAEMVHSIGLLSQGNEEMVRFAWTTFSDFQKARGRDPMTEEDHARIKLMVSFKETFCRENVNVHFLGLFDCVNSVGQFEIPLFRKTYRSIATPPATHIRHAVSIHERRLKFKPALFDYETTSVQSDIQEVWFAGNHGDVGGGWGRQAHQHRLLSDTPLAWMVQEILTLKDTANKLAFQEITVDRNQKTKRSFENLLTQPTLTNHQKRQLYMKPHDMLRFGGGASWFGTVCWWAIESLPFFTRLELESGKWVPRYWPPNFGASRDVNTFPPQKARFPLLELEHPTDLLEIKVPEGAIIHPTVEQMRKAGVLRADQMPMPGGNGASPTLHLPSRAVMQWKKLRNSRAASQLQSKIQSANCTGAAPQSFANKWDDIGELGAARWRWD